MPICPAKLATLMGLVVTARGTPTAAPTSGPTSSPSDSPNPLCLTTENVDTNKPDGKQNQWQFPGGGYDNNWVKCVYFAGCPRKLALEFYDWTFDPANNCCGGSCCCDYAEARNGAVDSGNPLWQGTGSADGCPINANNQILNLNQATPPDYISGPGNDFSFRVVTDASDTRAGIQLYWICPVPPTASPSAIPSGSPTGNPSVSPSAAPSAAPSLSPSPAPSHPPSPAPSRSPSRSPSTAPSAPPVSSPPTASPSQPPTTAPSTAPSRPPSTPPTKAPSGPPSTPPSRAPSTPPTATPSRAPSTTPTRAPSMPPAAPSSPPTAAPVAPPTTGPSPSPSGPPEPRPTSSPVRGPQPTTPPSHSPMGAPSGAPVSGPKPTPGPSLPPSAPPSPVPSIRPSLSPSVPQAPQPTAAPAHPTQHPSVTPSLPPTLLPTWRPTRGPLTERPSRAPFAPVSGCKAGEIKDAGGNCARCTPELVPGGCPGHGGGYAAPAPNGSVCLCRCRFSWEGNNCSICPTGYGGADCDRCAAAGAQPTLCEPPPCANPASLPGEVVKACGGGVQELALEVALRHSGIPATVRLSARGPGAAPQLRLSAHAPARQLPGGWLEVTGAEAQLSQWLQLTVIPAEVLTHLSPLTVDVNVSGTDCTEVHGEVILRCPAPAARVSGALPSASVPEGGSVAVPCSLSDLTNIAAPFSVQSAPPGAVRYDPVTGNCTVDSSALPLPTPPEGYRVVVTVAARGEAVPLDMRVEINPDPCGRGRTRAPLYAQLPPSGKGNEFVEPLPLDDLGGTFTSAELVGAPSGISVNRRDVGGRSVLRFEVSHEAREGTANARLRYAVPGFACVLSQPVFLFWGPAWLESSETIRQPVGVPFIHYMKARATGNIGALPWCPEPELAFLQEPGGLQVARRGVQWVVNGTLTAAGQRLAYMSATDCRGGKATLPVELYGVSGTELAPATDISFLEDANASVPVPGVLTTAPVLTLSVQAQVEAQRALGNLSAACPPGVTARPCLGAPPDADCPQGSGGLTLELSGPPLLLGQCAVTLIPHPHDCSVLQLLWRAEGAAREQSLVGLCAPDPPQATNVTRTVRWGDRVEQPFAGLLRSVDSGCVEFAAERMNSYTWLNPSAVDVSGVAPRDSEESYCQEVHGYTCRTNLFATAFFCVTALPSVRVAVPRERVTCTEDVACPIRGMILSGTALVTNDSEVTLRLVPDNPGLELKWEATVTPPVVDSEGSGAIRLSATLGSLRRALRAMLVATRKDFNGNLTITVEGATGTTVSASSPLSLHFTPVNDPPECKKGSCAEANVKMQCPMVASSELDLSAVFSDVDNAPSELVYELNKTAPGVELSGPVVRCSHVQALGAFFGVELSGSARVRAADPSRHPSEILVVEIEYQLTTAEQALLALLTAVVSFGSAALVLVRISTVAWCRECCRRCRDRPPPGTLVGRVCRGAAEALERADSTQTAGFAAAQAAGRWLRAERQALSRKAAAAAAAGRSCSTVRWGAGSGAFLVGICGEAAEDAGVDHPCCVVGPVRLGASQGKDRTLTPCISVLHCSSQAELKLTLRLRQAEGPPHAYIVGLASPLRCTTRLVSVPPHRCEYTGPARELTEWCHSRRIICPAKREAELVWRLSEPNSDRCLLHGTIPVCRSGKDAEVHGGDFSEASSPGERGVDEAADGDPLRTPLLAPWRPGRRPTRASRDLSPSPQAAVRVQFSSPAADQAVEGLKQELEEMRTRLQGVVEQAALDRRRAQELERRLGAAPGASPRGPPGAAQSTEAAAALRPQPEPAPAPPPSSQHSPAALRPQPEPAPPPPPSWPLAPAGAAPAAAPVPPEPLVAPLPAEEDWPSRPHCPLVVDWTPPAPPPAPQPPQEASPAAPAPPPPLLALRSSRPAHSRSSARRRQGGAWRLSGLDKDAPCEVPRADTSGRIGPKLATEAAPVAAASADGGSTEGCEADTVSVSPVALSGWDGDVPSPLGHHREQRTESPSVSPSAGSSGPTPPSSSPAFPGGPCGGDRPPVNAHCGSTAASPYWGSVTHALPASAELAAPAQAPGAPLLRSPGRPAPAPDARGGLPASLHLTGLPAAPTGEPILQWSNTNAPVRWVPPE